MPKLDEAKESLAMLKLWLGVIVGVFTAVVGWTLNKFEINENVLITLALAVLVVLLIIFMLIIRRINTIIKEIGKMKK
ncbi:hypothetical protein [Campylobacter mucosalis]|uniref:hypothetical protein n=1 Tax=Campylobacter mucosalis TaxID=202 RepID=UPI0014701BF8|nr:hypothetical protein [Campylobacter mucosalis]